jgi:hypothetical protein
MNDQVEWMQSQWNAQILKQIQLLLHHKCTGKHLRGDGYQNQQVTCPLHEPEEFILVYVN